MATMATSLLDWILDILRDPDHRNAFQHDPDGYARHHGFGDLSSADVHDALWLIADNQSASFDHHDRGHRDHDRHDGDRHDHHNQGHHYPPPHHYDHNEHAGHYLNSYIRTNSHFIDSRDTNFDDSIHQKVNTHGGDFDQHIDNDPVIASGDHAIAAHGDIRDSTLTSGNHNIVGDNDHAVTGSHNNTAFGSGNATESSFSDARFGDGSAVSLGGDADGHSEHNATNTSVHGGHGATSVNTAGDHASANSSLDQTHTDVDQHFEQDDHTRIDTHSESGSHDHVDASDSHDINIHP
jgi:hypothetical protein